MKVVYITGVIKRHFLGCTILSKSMYGKKIKQKEWQYSTGELEVKSCKHAESFELRKGSLWGYFEGLEARMIV